MSEWLKEHAWKACVGETLPRVRIPLSPPSNLFLSNGLPLFGRHRLQHVSKTAADFRGLQQPDRAVERRATEMHVPLRRREIPVPSQFLNRSRRRTAHRINGRRALR